MPKARKPSPVGQVPQDSPDRKLTDKQKLFVHEYLKDFNALQAAKRAGYSEKTAYSIGHENLKKPEVRGAIDAILDERKKNLNINQERALREWELIAFSRMKNYVRVSEGRVTLLDTDDMEEGLDAAVQSYAETTTEHGGSIQIKLYDKVGALNSLSKHLKLFKEDDDDGEDKQTESDRIRGPFSEGLSEAIEKLKGSGEVS